MCNQGSQLGRVWSPVETRLTGAVLDSRLPAIIIMITMIMIAMMTNGDDGNSHDDNDDDGDENYLANAPPASDQPLPR